MITRRELIRYCQSGLLSSFFASTMLPELGKSFANQPGGKPPVIWLQGACCTGCSVSLLNSSEPPVFDLLQDIIALNYHPTIMGPSSADAMRIAGTHAVTQPGKYILIVEGAIPRAGNGAFCTCGMQNGREISMLEQFGMLAEQASVIAAVGTCASYGGIPASGPNPTGACGLQDSTDKKVINIPGCPPHPDWIIGTLSHLILYGIPELDESNRPAIFYGQNIHEKCPNVSRFENNEMAAQFGGDGCLGMLGCKGGLTNADCPSRRWNNEKNWCVGSGSLCFGCTEPGFPDEMSPFFS